MFGGAAIGQVYFGQFTFPDLTGSFIFPIQQPSNHYRDSWQMI